MATLLADPPVGPGVQQPPAAPPDGPTPPPAEEQAAAQRCAHCASALAPGQDWCLQCGSAAPGSLGAGSPGWRTAAVVLGSLAVLIGGAAAAGYAALSKSPGHKRSTALAQSRVPAAAVPPPAASSTAVPPPTVPVTPPPKIGAPTTIKPTVPLKAPKIPLSLPAVKAPAVTSPPATGPTRHATSTPTTTTPKSTGGSSITVTEAPTAILLDTNAASTYNPYSYPASNFGDPARAIDGDTSTGWSARVDPAVAPRMAEGVLIDLKSAQRLSALELVTSTPGMTIQVYGASGHSAPASITDPAWKRLSGLIGEHKSRDRIRLSRSAQAQRFVTVWISQAPPSAARVTINEFELFPAAK